MKNYIFKVLYDGEVVGKFNIDGKMIMQTDPYESKKDAFRIGFNAYQTQGIKTPMPGTMTAITFEIEEIEVKTAFQKSSDNCLLKIKSRPGPLGYFDGEILEAHKEGWNDAIEAIQRIASFTPDFRELLRGMKEK